MLGAVLRVSRHRHNSNYIVQLTKTHTQLHTHDSYLLLWQTGPLAPSCLLKSGHAVYVSWLNSLSCI